MYSVKAFDRGGNNSSGLIIIVVYGGVGFNISRIVQPSGYVRGLYIYSVKLLKLLFYVALLMSVIVLNAWICGEARNVRASYLRSSFFSASFKLLNLV